RLFDTARTRQVPGIGEGVAVGVENGAAALDVRAMGEDEVVLGLQRAAVKIDLAGSGNRIRAANGKNAAIEIDRTGRREIQRAYNVDQTACLSQESRSGAENDVTANIDLAGLHVNDARRTGNIADYIRGRGGNSQIAMQDRPST